MATLTSTQLKQLAKKTLELEKEALYGEAQSQDQRVTSLERMLLEEARKAAKE